MMMRGRRRMCLIWSGRRGGQAGGDQGGSLVHLDCVHISHQILIISTVVRGVYRFSRS